MSLGKLPTYTTAGPLIASAVRGDVPVKLLGNFISRSDVSFLIFVRCGFRLYAEVWHLNDTELKLEGQLTDCYT